MAMAVAAFSKILRKRSSLSRIVVADASGGLGALTRCRVGLASPGPFGVRFFAAIAGPPCSDSWHRLGTPTAPQPSPRQSCRTRRSDFALADEHQTNAGRSLRNAIPRQYDCHVVFAAVLQGR